MCFNEFFLCLNPHLGLTCGPITGGWGLILLFEFKIKEGFVIPANVWPGSATVTNWGCCAIICALIYINWQENMCLVFTSYRLGLKTFIENFESKESVSKYHGIYESWSSSWTDSVQIVSFCADKNYQTHYLVSTVRLNDGCHISASTNLCTQSAGRSQRQVSITRLQERTPGRRGYYVESNTFCRNDNYIGIESLMENIILSVQYFKSSIILIDWFIRKEYISSKKYFFKMSLHNYIGIFVDMLV